MNENRNEKIEKYIKEHRSFGKSLEQMIAEGYNAKVLDDEDINYVLSFNTGFNKEKFESFVNKSEKEEDTMNEEEIKKHIKGIEENKDVISDAVYNHKPEVLAKLYNDGILNDNDLKILSDTSEYKVDGVKTVDLYNEVKTISEQNKKQENEEQNLSDLFKNQPILDKPNVEALSDGKDVIPPVGGEIIENNEDNNRLKVDPNTVAENMDKIKAAEEFKKAQEKAREVVTKKEDKKEYVKSFLDAAEEYKKAKEAAEAKKIEEERKKQERNKLYTKSGNKDKAENKEEPKYLHPLKSFKINYVEPELLNIDNDTLNSNILSGYVNNFKAEKEKRLDSLNISLSNNEVEQEKIEEEINDLNHEKAMLEDYNENGCYEELKAATMIENKFEKASASSKIKAKKKENEERINDINALLREKFSLSESLKNSYKELEAEQHDLNLELESFANTDSEEEFRKEQTRILTELNEAIAKLEEKDFPNLDNAKEYTETQKEKYGEDAEPSFEDIEDTKRVYDLLNEEKLLLIRRRTAYENLLGSEVLEHVNLNNEELDELNLKIEEEISKLDKMTEEEQSASILSLASLVNKRDNIKNELRLNNGDNSSVKEQVNNSIKKIDEKLAKIDEAIKTVDYQNLYNAEQNNNDFGEIIPSFIVTDLHDKSFYNNILTAIEKKHNINDNDAKDLVGKIRNIKYDKSGKIDVEDELKVKRIMNEYNLSLSEVYKYKDNLINWDAINANEEFLNGQKEKKYFSRKRIIDSLSVEEREELLNVPLKDENGNDRKSIPELRSLADKYQISPYSLYSYVKSRKRKFIGPMLVIKEKAFESKYFNTPKKRACIIAAVIGVGIFIGTLINNHLFDKNAKDAGRDAMDADNETKYEQEIQAEDGLATGEEVNEFEVGGQTYTTGSHGGGVTGTSNNTVNTDAGGNVEVDEEFDHTGDTGVVDETDPDQKPDVPVDPEDPEISVELPYLEEGGMWQMSDGFIKYDGTVVYTGSDGKTYTAKLSPEYFTYVDGKMYLTEDVFNALSNNNASIVDTINKGEIVLDDVKETEQDSNTNNSQVNDNNNNNSSNTSVNETVFVKPAPETPGVGENVYPSTPITSSEEDKVNTPEESNENFNSELPDVNEELNQGNITEEEANRAEDSVLDYLNKGNSAETTSTVEEKSRVTDELKKLKEEAIKHQEAQKAAESYVQEDITQENITQENITQENITQENTSGMSR